MTHFVGPIHVQLLNRDLVVSKFVYFSYVSSVLGSAKEKTD